MSKTSSSISAHTYFIADLHLDPDKKASYNLAVKFFRQMRKAKSLYILGDLFEYWIGDDAGVLLYADVMAALADVSSAGCKLHVMLGNRDFLLGDEFARVSGANLIRQDELVIELDDAPVLLMHGDTLCTRDLEYQAFRKQVRDTQWQHSFLTLSIDERIAYANGLRNQSSEHSALKRADVMDVTASEVQSRLKANQCHLLIHGHTHRPNEHWDDTHQIRRLVVGDWHPDHARYVVHNADGYQLHNFTG